MEIGSFPVPKQPQFISIPLTQAEMMAAMKTTIRIKMPKETAFILKPKTKNKPNNSSTQGRQIAIMFTKK